MTLWTVSCADQLEVYDSELKKSISIRRGTLNLVSLISKHNSKPLKEYFYFVDKIWKIGFFILKERPYLVERVFKRAHLIFPEPFNLLGKEVLKFSKQLKEAVSYLDKYSRTPWLRLRYYVRTRFKQKKQQENG